MLKGRKSNRKAAQPAALLYRKLLLLSCFLLSTAFFVLVIYLSGSPSLPSIKKPLILYSNQCNDPIKTVYLKAIKEAQSSLFLIIYGLTDRDVIRALQSKKAEGVDLRIFFDPVGSKGIEQDFPEGVAFPTKSRGLMHKKILVVDHKQIFTGSANLTETSLRLHDNLVLGCYDTGLAYFLESSLDSSYRLQIDNQEIEFWSLPEQEQKALSRLLEEIDKAKKSIKICMFTFTHRKIYQSLLDAKTRGVDISIAIDYYSSRGASKNMISNLYRQGITPYIGAPGKLLHNKWCLIDDDTLICGSTNWTHSAFTKNDDSLIFLPRLSKKKANYIKNIWKQTEYTSTIYSENAIN